jgi:hypothetical protein
MVSDVGGYYLMQLQIEHRCYGCRASSFFLRHEGGGEGWGHVNAGQQRLGSGALAALEGLTPNLRPNEQKNSLNRMLVLHGA